MPLRLEKKKTESSPYLLIDEKKGYMMMEGKSFQENVGDFFQEVIEWLDGYLATNFGEFTFDCKMDYFNSSTFKGLLNIILKMDKYSVGGNKAIVNWIADSDNEVIIECAEDFQEVIDNLEFNLVIR